jgi:transposase
MQPSSEKMTSNHAQLAWLPPAAATDRAPAAPAAGKPLVGRRYKQGQDLRQAMLLPPSVDDYVAADHPVRAITAYVDNAVDVSALGLAHSAGTLSAGQPAYDPADLLKLYLYGYLNRVRSSRRLAAECGRNLEVMWLIKGLRPGYHTIADFRKANAKALVAVNRDFVALCRELGLFGGERVGLDGSFFHGNASAASIQTKQQLERALSALERDIARYHQEIDSGDSAEAGPGQEAAVTPEQLAALTARAAAKRTALEELAQSGETQLSRTDPDARRLSKNGTKVTGYNVQSVVDAKHRLILTHEVTNAGNDLGQLVPMAEQAKAELGMAPQEPLEVLADAGYFTEADIAACHDKAIIPYVPLPEKNSVAAAEGRLPGQAFDYDAEQDVFRCPGGQTLPPHGKPTLKNGVLRQCYASKAKVCKGCALRAQCLPEKSAMRRIYRCEHAAAVERHRQHMQAAGAVMRERAGLCEHPFGTLKRWLGWDHFLVRSLSKVRGEMALVVHCYNFRRVLSLFGVAKFIAICKARRVAAGKGARALWRLYARHLQRLWRGLWGRRQIFSALARHLPTP